MKKSRKGQIIIEAVVAISVGVVALLGIFSLVSRSFSLNNQIGEKFVATYLSAEGIEVVKNIIDTNYTKGGLAWDSGILSNSYEVEYDDNDLNTIASNPLTPLKFKDGIYAYNLSGGTTSIYTREVKIANNNDNKIGIYSTVYWKSKSGVESVTLQDYFYNWR